MKLLIDTAATSQRHLTATQIWEMVWNDIVSKYGSAPIRALSRVYNIRNGGQRTDHLRDIEQTDMALLSDLRAPFLQFNTPVYEGTVQHRIIGWGHPGLFNLLKTPGIHLFLDGTFRIVPNRFSQLLVVMIRDYATDLYIPVFYVLLTGKSTLLYEYALQFISTVIRSPIRPAQVYCDFEKSLINAVKSERC